MHRQVCISWDKKYWFFRKVCVHIKWIIPYENNSLNVFKANKKIQLNEVTGEFILFSSWRNKPKNLRIGIRVVNITWRNLEVFILTWYLLLKINSRNDISCIFISLSLFHLTQLMGASTFFTKLCFLKWKQSLYKKMSLKIEHRIIHSPTPT